MNKNNSQKRPLIFDIARGSTVDGPGIRTVVFFKGCPLRCLWCQNPESQSPRVETMYYPEKCIHCGNCEKGEACYTLARQTVGKAYPARELAQLILRDKIFYETSAGGVTFSGGEPLLHIDYISQVAAVLQAENIHTAVETCGYFDYMKLEKKLLHLIDLFLFDIKIMDAGKHKEWVAAPAGPGRTDKSNEIILRNFENLLAAGAQVIPRVPLIPGFTASEENLSQIAQLFIEQGIEEYALLPYNPSGMDKWERLGKKRPGGLSEKPMTQQEEQKWLTFFKDRLSCLSA